MSAAPPVTVDTPAGTPADLIAPPLTRRMAAFLYEGVLLFGVLFATGLAYAIAVRQTNAMQHRSGLVATCFIVLAVYFVGLWTRSGQTLAMKTWHLRVVTAAGHRLTPYRALARYLAAWLWFAPPLALVSASGLPPSTALYFGVPLAWVVLYAVSTRVHPRRQFWHDALCGTAIVDLRPSRPLPQ